MSFLLPGTHGKLRFKVRNTASAVEITIMDKDARRLADLSISPEQARALAALLTARAEKVEKTKADVDEC
uniref:hypothetical protein n=1 Tax=Magnetospirillum sp. ME-1 TaxID=1639348 RepID=UPI001445CFD3|nr:hypothetical protein [Magnetospirillum sp. ME-1]